MNGNEFLRRTRNLAKQQGVRWAFEPKRGKGSHGTIYFGDRKTTIPDRRKDVPKGLLSAMCRQLGIRKEDIE
jgi:mRNA interferase HicA